MAETKLHGRGIFGLVLVLIGLSLLARNFNLFTPGLEFALFNWPMLLIVIGAFLLLSSGRNTTGWILLIIGVAFWMPRIFDFAFDFHQIFWPVVFIALGLALVFRTYRGYSPEPVTGENHRDSIDDVAILGGNERKITSRYFKGGRVTSVFGGSEINLLEAEMAPGENVIDMFTLFGGTTFYVPGDWEVKVEVQSILGGFEDKRNLGHRQVYIEDRMLVIKGTVLLGGGEIKNG